MDKFMETITKEVLLNNDYVDLDKLQSLATRCILSNLSAHKYVLFKLAVKSKVTKFHTDKWRTTKYKQLTGYWPASYELLENKEHPWNQKIL